MPPIISIVGKSSSGKTTFLEKLIHEITSRGYKVATIKHSHHSISFDNPNKDSWRHEQAGANATMVSSTSEIQIIKPVPQELTVDELARNLSEDFDLILTEGFSHGDMPKIEVHRKEAGPLLENACKLLSIITNEPLDTEVKQFSFDNVKGVADLVEKDYIKPNLERLTLYINGERIPLVKPANSTIDNILEAIAIKLKEVREIKDFELRFHKA
jgi:molybdopterin-guanine dinucleotide biosynthesis adapter protein